MRFSIVPSSFSQGLLIPILKKPTLDALSPSNYRPIVISCTFSKIFELHVLDEVNTFKFSDLQFGFVSGRSTDIAATLARDVIDYSCNRGSPVYTCSLDAQGAFDIVPHSVIFYKTINVIPDYCWAAMVTWYNSICVKIRQDNLLSKPIKICKGTRQGGLSSPFLFNV